MNYSHYIRVLSKPIAGNWIRYIDYLSTPETIVGIAPWLTWINPSTQTLMVPIRHFSRNQKRLIPQGTRTRSIIQIWEFEDSKAPESLTDDRLIDMFGRLFCDLIFTDKLDAAISEDCKGTFIHSTTLSLPPTNGLRASMFLHQILNRDAEKAFQAASIQFKLIGFFDRQTKA